MNATEQRFAAYAFLSSFKLGVCVQLCIRHVILVVCLFVLGNTGRAELTISTVPIGNPGNPADTRYTPTGIGSVAYNFRLATTEVTNAQYVEFLNNVDP